MLVRSTDYIDDIVHTCGGCHIIRLMAQFGGAQPSMPAGSNNNDRHVPFPDSGGGGGGVAFAGAQQPAPNFGATATTYSRSPPSGTPSSYGRYIQKRGRVGSAVYCLDWLFNFDPRVVKVFSLRSWVLFDLFDCSVLAPLDPSIEIERLLCEIMVDFSINFTMCLFRRLNVLRVRCCACDCHQ